MQYIWLDVPGEDGYSLGVGKQVLDLLLEESGQRDSSVARVQEVQSLSKSQQAVDIPTMRSPTRRLGNARVGEQNLEDRIP